MKMIVKTRGVVIQQRSIGEQDKIITILSEDFGVIEASARGVKRMKSGLAGGIQMLSYSAFALFKGKSGYIINSAEILEAFYDLRLDVKNVSLASYFCEIIKHLTPGEEGAAEYLRLLLNTLYFLCNHLQTPPFLKMVFELRVMCIAGFAPALDACAVCGKTFADSDVTFLPNDGVLCCQDCLREIDATVRISLNVTTLTALRYLTESDLAHVLKAQMDESLVTFLGSISEYYVLAHCERGFKTLDLYRSL